jgi:hypothetical protein
MNRYQLAALQLMLLQNKELPTKWLASVTKPCRFSEPDIAFHKGGPLAKSPGGYATNATESSYVWDLGKIAEEFRASGP